MKILVIQQKMIGDVLTSTILCESLKASFPAAEIHYLINSNTVAVVQNNPFVNQIVPFSNKEHTSKVALYRFLKYIRTQKYDWVVDAYGKLESNLITLFSGASQKMSYYKWYTSFLYTHKSMRSNKPITHAGLAIENRLRLLCKEEAIKESIIAPKIFLTSEEINHARDYLQKNQINFDKPVVMIGVLGSGQNKTLPAVYMAKLLDRLIEFKEVTLLYNYIPSQLKEAQEIFDLCNSKTQSHTKFNVFGNSLREFLAIMYHCDLLIGNEGGAVNMAKALNKPTFTIFSPWIPQEGWNLFEDGIKHKSVHLKQFRADLYEGKSVSQLKKNALELYKHFSPELILPVFEKYIKNYA